MSQDEANYDGDRMFRGHSNVRYLLFHFRGEYSANNGIEYVVSPANFVSLIPEDLNPEAVAPLLCGTFFRSSSSKNTANGFSRSHHVRRTQQDRKVI